MALQETVYLAVAFPLLISMLTTAEEVSCSRSIIKILIVVASQVGTNASWQLTGGVVKQTRKKSTI